jgi:hypothetical protein
MFLCGSLFVGLKWLPSSTFGETFETEETYAQLIFLFFLFFVTNQVRILIIQNISFFF